MQSLFSVLQTFNYLSAKRRIMQDQTSEQVGSWDPPVNVHFLTTPTRSRPLNPATNAKRRRSRTMNRESLMWNMEPSLHGCSAPLAAWEDLPGQFMPALPTSYPSTTDQICSNNGIDLVQYQLFFDESSNYVPSWNLIE